MGNDTLKTLGIFGGGVVVLCGIVYGFSNVVSYNRNDNFAATSGGGSAVTKKRRHKRNKQTKWKSNKSKSK